MFRNFLFSFLIRPRIIRGAGKLLYQFSTLLKSNYSVWMIKKMWMRFIILVNDDEDVVVGITDTNGNILFLHPHTMEGIKRVQKLKDEGSTTG